MRDSNITYATKQTLKKKRTHTALLLVVAVMVTASLVLPTAALADFEGSYSLSFMASEQQVRTLTVDLPEGSDSVALPLEEVPTAAEVAEAAATEAALLGWRDTATTDSPLYTTNEELAAVEAGYAYMGEFVITRDTVFQAEFAPVPEDTPPAEATEDTPLSEAPVSTQEFSAQEFSAQGISLMAASTQGTSWGNTIDLSDATITYGTEELGWKYYQSAVGNGGYYEINGGYDTITITGDGTSLTNPVSVQVKSGVKVTITLKNATMAAGKYLTLMLGSEVTLSLTGTNTASPQMDTYDDRAATLTITGSGTLNAIGSGLNAGIHVPKGGTLTIQSGTINAIAGHTAGEGGAGIGGKGGSNGKHPGGDITINGGTIYAEGYEGGAGIGGGHLSNAGTITINGGTVTAIGVYDTPNGNTNAVGGAGIGGGGGQDYGYYNYDSGPATKITISSSAKVTAYSEDPHRPALDAKTISAGAYLVNAYFTDSLPNATRKLNVYEYDSDTPLHTLDMPQTLESRQLSAYRCFAYTTSNKNPDIVEVQRKTDEVWSFDGLAVHEPQGGTPITYGLTPKTGTLTFNWSYDTNQTVLSPHLIPLSLRPNIFDPPTFEVEGGELWLKSATHDLLKISLKGRANTPLENGVDYGFRAATTEGSLPDAKKLAWEPDTNRTNPNPDTDPFPNYVKAKTTSDLTPNTKYVMESFLETRLGPAASHTFVSETSAEFATLPKITSASADGTTTKTVSATFFENTTEPGENVPISSVKLYYSEKVIDYSNLDDVRDIDGTSLTAKTLAANQFTDAGFNNYALTGLSSNTPYDILIVIDNRAVDVGFTWGDSDDDASTFTNTGGGRDAWLISEIRVIGGTPAFSDVTSESATLISTGQDIPAGLGSYLSGGFRYSKSDQIDTTTGLLTGTDATDLAWTEALTGGKLKDPLSLSAAGLEPDTTYYLQTQLTYTRPDTTTETLCSTTVSFTTEAAPKTTLTISNTVSGEFANPDMDFTYSVTLKDADGEYLKGPLAYTGGGSKEDGSLTLVGGVGTFTLKGGESICMADIPLTGTVRIMQAGAANYLASYIDPLTGSDAISADKPGDDLVLAERTMSESRTISFTNAQGEVVPSAVDTGDLPLILIALAVVALVTLCLIQRLTRRSRLLRRKAEGSNCGDFVEFRTSDGNRRTMKRGTTDMRTKGQQQESGIRQ
jgi:hypothetical protein